MKKELDMGERYKLQQESMYRLRLKTHIPFAWIDIDIDEVKHIINQIVTKDPLISLNRGEVLINIDEIACIQRLPLENQDEER